ncbi:2,4'-dihydroxyacetophenone dioxygenase family protein [Streptomyces sp. NPDC051322]|uniref:2,4'-dihydroxyacetophenone dioxygenase family protein n=1 Tax=Streptomyces sp. NPDC051322 TaxID=3154645 RepID=UPI00344E9D89
MHDIVSPNVSEGPVISASPVVPPEIAVAALPNDDRVWVPQAPHVWFRPLMFNTVTGQWCNLLKVTSAGIVSRHRHPGAVFGYVIKGKWHYHEHEWTADAGHFVYEPPGETHTLAVPEDCPEMITFFNITGAMAYVDANGVQIGYEDTFTKIEMCRAHYAKVGLGADYVEQFIR